MLVRYRFVLFCFVFFSQENGNNSYFVVEQGAYSLKVLLFGNSQHNNLEIGISVDASQWKVQKATEIIFIIIFGLASL